MRALLTTLPLLAAADGAAAHALDAGHSLAEQLAHQVGAPHHVLLLLGALAIAVVLHRRRSARHAENRAEKD